MYQKIYYYYLDNDSAPWEEKFLQDVPENIFLLFR